MTLNEQQGELWRQVEKGGLFFFPLSNRHHWHKLLLQWLLDITMVKPEQRGGQEVSGGEGGGGSADYLASGCERTLGTACIG